MARQVRPGSPQPAAISPTEELLSESSAAQTVWLHHLLHSGDRVAMDIVRGWNRLPGLYPTGSTCLTVHLVRDPVSWAEAHLLPSGRGSWRKPIGDAWRKFSLFQRRGFYNNYQYQEIIEQALLTSHPVMCQTALSPDELSKAPAYLRLLAFWWGANRTLWRSASESGLAPLLVTHDDFTRDPQSRLAEIATAADWRDARFDSRAVVPARRSATASDPRWADGLRRLGLPSALATVPHLTADLLRSCFEAASPAALRGVA